MLTKEQKLKVIAAIHAQQKNFSSRKKHAVTLGISPAQLTRILRAEPETEGVIGEARWVSIARKYDVQLVDEFKMHTAKTEVFKFVWAQLKFAQENSVSGILCDRADIGKTHTAMMYARENRNVAYVDCGRHKTKTAFIRAIAREFGLTHTGLYSEIFEDVVYYLNTTTVRPLIILDEFGDLSYPTYLEFKALWNATDKHCGFYAMGADGLATKLNRNIEYKKVGFAEIFSRLGNKYQRITPYPEQEFIQFQRKQIAEIGLANACQDVQRLHAKTNMSLRRIPIMLSLERKTAQHGN